MVRKIKFWLDIWMDESPLIDKISMDQRATINDEEKVSMFITKIKTWKIRELQ